MSRLGLLAGSALIALAAVPATAGAAPPAPCNNAPQITDVSGDGHHDGTDVLAAWWSEASGHLQAVIQTRSGLWLAQHDDAQVNGSGYALVYNGSSYLRARGPAADRPADPVLFDYGTYTAAGGFVAAGTTTGATESGPSGTVTIDVPPVAPGTRLAAPYVLTYDGINDGQPTWVDHAPGGESPTDPSVGADYIVGSCNAAPTTTTAVTLSAPKSVTGAKTVTVSGKVTPARGGVAVTISRDAYKDATSTATTAADGSYSVKLAIGETTRLRAVAETIGSNELTVTAKSKVRIKVKRRAKDGAAIVTGTVDPKLPGKVQWLPSNGVKPVARTTTKSGKFRLVIKHPKRGRYQAVVIPDGERAERATSNTGVIR